MGATSMLGVAMLAAPAAAQATTCSTTTKCFFAVSVSPGTAAAGASNTFTFTIENEASPQQLGAVQISAPTGFMITSASVAPGSAGTASFTSSTAQFLNLSLAPSSTTMLTVTATVLSPGGGSCSSGSYQWPIAAKQSNNFNGSGNDFQLDPQSAKNLLGKTTGSCTQSTPTTCPPGTPCSVSASSATTSVTVTTSSPLPSGDVVVAGIESTNDYTCPTYTSSSAEAVFGVFNAAGAPQPIPLTVTLRIDKSVVNMSGHPGASSWQICFASQSSFTVRPGTTLGTATIGGSLFNTGLLPDCSGSQGAPCVQSRNKNNAGDVLVTFLSSGDPFGKG